MLQETRLEEIPSDLGSVANCIVVPASSTPKRPEQLHGGLLVMLSKRLELPSAAIFEDRAVSLLFISSRISLRIISCYVPQAGLGSSTVSAWWNRFSAWVTQLCAVDATRTSPTVLLVLGRAHRYI